MSLRKPNSDYYDLFYRSVNDNSVFSSLSRSEKTMYLMGLLNGLTSNCTKLQAKDATEAYNNWLNVI